jgi:hypothetical protein
MKSYHMAHELEIIWKELVIFLLEVLSQHFNGGNEENHE